MIQEITLRQLSEKIGVSSATISMALNNKQGVSSATREYVLEKVREHGYQPLRRSASGKNKRIYLLIKKTEKHLEQSPFFSKMVECIERQASQNGAGLLIKYIGDTDILSGFSSLVAAIADAEGVIIHGALLSAGDIALLEKLDIPGIIVDNACPGASVSTLSINNEGGIRASIDYLMGQGHRRIGYIRWEIPHLDNFAARYSAYERVLGEKGMDKAEVITLSGRGAECFSQMERYLAGRKLSATALLADGDYIAIAAMRALKDGGYRVPEDVSVIGFDDDSLCEVAEPSLTTSRVPVEELGRLAVDLLLYRIKNPAAPHTHLFIDTSLVIRNSVACKE